ncbi:hypothetical protein M569_02818 [Genlisea aurea]|uniref:TF-B3 domain-containing protein n=1 Tax=Genlisea aurea TaxID=192259 RepID=S8E7X3_9LAMI|nr:hypothetical protein M569_02818 [Genlisea aurea]
MTSKGKAPIEEPKKGIEEGSSRPPGKRKRTGDAEGGIFEPTENLEPLVHRRGYHLLRKTLRRYHVIPHGAELPLTEDEAYLLTQDERIFDSPTKPFTRILTAFDCANVQYAMKVTGAPLGFGRMQYFVAGGWSRFVVAHQLKEGDEVSFQVIDGATDENGWYCVAVRYHKKPISKGKAPLLILDK